MRMCFIVFDVVAKGLRIIFKREWDIRFKKTLGKWMDKPTNGRDFCSMESPRNQQMRARLLATMINGNTEEWDLLMLFYAILSTQRVLDAELVQKSVQQWMISEIFATNLLTLPRPGSQIQTSFLSSTKSLVLSSHSVSLLVR